MAEVKETYSDNQALQEKCGIVAFYGFRFERKLPLLLHAAGGIQHRGQQGAGIVLLTKKGTLKYTGEGLLREIFQPPVIAKLNKPSFWTLLHCRYGTNGAYIKRNLQPCVVKTKKNEVIALVHNGEFAQNNILKKVKKKFKKDVSDTFLFAQLLKKFSGKDWDEKIVNLLSQVRGSYSLIIGIDKTIYAARDPFGIRPLVLGKLKDRFIIASETHALDKIGAQLVRGISPGEIIKIDEKGLQIINSGERDVKNHFCDFEWAYFSRPDSFLPVWNSQEKKHAWLSVNSFREKCGRVLAKEAPIKNATFAVGIPDSGITLTTAYANALKIPYRQIIVRDHYDRNGDQRLFMRDDQMKKIKKKVLGKLSIIPEKNVWKDAIVVIGDDSIVRGNVSQQITKALLSFGVKEVHWILGFPPVKYRCHLGVSIRTGEELIAANLQGNPKKIAKKIKAASVNYISNEGFIKARLLGSKIVIPKNKQHIFLENGGCGGCITGIYPVGRTGKTYNKC